MRGPLYSTPHLLSGKISIMARPRGGDWLVDEIKALHASGVDILVSLLTAAEVQELDLTAEEACCHQQGMVYRSFAIIDRGVPPLAEQTFLFLECLHRSLAEGKHLAFHCRHGLGRAGLMAASLLVLIGFTPEHAFEQLSQIRGHRVPETEEQRAWVVAFFQSHRSGCWGS